MKTIHRILLCAMALLLLTAGLIGPAQAEDTVFAQKHVALVYDDSASMSNNGRLTWAFASYAVQTFTALLDEADSLSVTFMNKQGYSSSGLTGDRQALIDSLRESTATANGGTPMSSVFDGLTSLLDQGLQEGVVSNSGEQYYLVLMTDGWYEYNGNWLDQVSCSRVLAEEFLEPYPDLHVIYFGMGKDCVDFRNPDRGATDLNRYENFTQVYAADPNQIADVMQTLSNLIAGRYTVTEGVSVSGNTVEMDIG